MEGIGTSPKLNTANHQMALKNSFVPKEIAGDGGYYLNVSHHPEQRNIIIQYGDIIEEEMGSAEDISWNECDTSDAILDYCSIIEEDTYITSETIGVSDTGFESPIESHDVQSKDCTNVKALNEPSSARSTLVMQISNSRTKAANCRKCEFCETVLNTRLVNAYSQHCLEEHDRSLFTCPQCGDVFHLQTHFKEHLIAEHSLDEVNEFVTQNLWREFVHNGELMAECRYCYLVFRTQNSCTRHEKLHLKELQQRCYQDDGLSSKVSYGHPKPRCPPNMENYTRYCNICYRIVSKRNFREHMASHNSVREHSCPVCKKTFKVRRTATRHIQTHVNASNLKRKCYECDAVLSSESDIPDHYSSEHPTICPYRCPICGDGFMDKLPLKRHCHTHTDAERLEVSLKQPLISYKIDHACIYECTACYRSFNTKRATIAHWIVHTDRPYKCPQCHATFRIEDKLEQHTMDAHQQQVDEVESPL